MGTLPEIQPSSEKQGENHIHGTPAQSFAEPHDMARAVEDLEVQHQHAQREKVEENPEVEQTVVIPAVQTFLVVEF